MKWEHETVHQHSPTCILFAWNFGIDCPPVT
jgi:hypothetical protein